METQTVLITTPVGTVSDEYLSELQRLAGFKKDDYNGGWSLIIEKVKGRKINPATERKANEKNMVEMEMWIPVRYYNFIFAKTLCGDVTSAMGFVKKQLLERGEPVFLPAQIARNNPTLLEYVSYSKVMKLCEDVGRDPFNQKILQDYWNGKAENKQVLKEAGTESFSY